jgi:hypothetical protein
MKALFLGHFAATVGPRILAKVKTPLDTSILDDEGDVKQLAPLLADAEIVIGHIWRAGFPPHQVVQGKNFRDQRLEPAGLPPAQQLGEVAADQGRVAFGLRTFSPSEAR